MPNYSSPGSTHRSAKKPVVTPTGSPDGKTQSQAKKMLMDDTQLSILKNNLRIAGMYVNSRYLEMLSPASGGSLYKSEVKEMNLLQKNHEGIAIYQIRKLIYNENENFFEKMVSVYSALNSFGGLVAMILQSDGHLTKLYLCTNTSGNGKVAGKLLANNLKGQLNGCEIEELDDSEKNTLLNSYGMRNAASVGRTVRSLSMIPSRRDDERQHDREYSAQGYEKFIDAMNGYCYTLVVLSQRVSPNAMDNCLEGMESLYTVLSPYAKETVSYGESESDTVNYSISSSINSSISQSISKSFGTSHTNSISEGRSANSSQGYGMFGLNFNSGSGWSYGSSTAMGISDGTSRGESTSDGVSSGDSQSSGTTKGSNYTLTMNRENKAVQDMLAKIEEHINRINLSQTFGMWNSACYMIADDVATVTMGTSTLASLFSGDSQVSPRAYYNQWDATNMIERERVLDYIQNLQHPVINLTMFQEIIDASGKASFLPYKAEQITPAMMISGKEVPILMGLPRKSVPGVEVDRMAEFGRNIPERWKKEVKRSILFGNVYHMGKEETTETLLNLDTFASHVFICGTSGSGKSNTTYNLLQKMIENKIPFLVIEPVKGEYKIEFAGLQGINIFTVDESPYRFLQINPFEFSASIHIREHLDNIVQVISACWPLYGAMPGLLKQAFEQVYLDHGWDLEHSERIAIRGNKFPVFKDLYTALERIINESPYSMQTKADYKGALLNRISSLCNGFEGQIFGRSIGIPDSTLFNKNTIIDLSSIGSDETRSLIMGILIIKLKNFRKGMGFTPNSELVHVTVLEEAHNILKRCSQETSSDSGNIQGEAVGSLCRCIAEMRSSGEGFIIIDQSPGAVDETAIKNTAIKIAMRLPSKEDCEEISVALSLNENQMRELSRLNTGVAAIYHAGWTDTLLAKMGKIWDKRYRLKSIPSLDVGTYTRIQGAVVQLMYQDLIENNLGSMYDDIQELISLLCKGTGAIRPVLSGVKQQELLDEVQIFLENNDGYIKSRRIKDMKREFFDFVFNFLRLDSVMRIFTLNIVKASSKIEPFTTKEIRAVLKWEKEVREGISRYLYMPKECDPDKAYKWPAIASDSEYFWPIYEGILDQYGKRCSADSAYPNAVSYLKSVKPFSNGTSGGK